MNKKQRASIAEALDKIGYELEEKTDEEFDIYITNLLANVPHKCNFCDEFSGNKGIPRNSEIGVCMHPKSIYYLKKVSENADCGVFKNDPVSL